MHFRFQFRVAGGSRRNPGNPDDHAIRQEIFATVAEGFFESTPDPISDHGRPTALGNDEGDLIPTGNFQKITDQQLAGLSLPVGLEQPELITPPQDLFAGESVTFRIGCGGQSDALIHSGPSAYGLWHADDSRWHDHSWNECGTKIRADVYDFLMKG